MKNKLYRLSFVIFFMFIILLNYVNAYHTTNVYGRYDDENPRYHCDGSYYNYHSTYRHSNPYREYHSYSNRYRDYYYRYHPLTYYPRSTSSTSSLRRDPINIRIENSDNVEVRVY